jgi:hypothetical protein
VRLSELPGLLKVTNLRVAVAVTSIVVIGNFAAYTYVTPFLMNNVGIGPNLISALLLCYGAAGVAGNFVAGVAAGRGRSLRKLIIILIAGLSGAIALLLAAGAAKPAAIAFLVIWGVTYSACRSRSRRLFFAVCPMPGMRRPRSMSWLSTSRSHWVRCSAGSPSTRKDHRCPWPSASCSVWSLWQRRRSCVVTKSGMSDVQRPSALSRTPSTRHRLHLPGQ